jgi:hypothetical protein
VSLQTEILYAENVHRINLGIDTASGGADDGASGGHATDNRATERRPILMGKKPFPGTAQVSPGCLEYRHDRADE